MYSTGMIRYRLQRKPEGSQCECSFVLQPCIVSLYWLNIIQQRPVWGKPDLPTRYTSDANNKGHGSEYDSLYMTHETVLQYVYISRSILPSWIMFRNISLSWQKPSVEEIAHPCQRKLNCVIRAKQGNMTINWYWTVYQPRMDPWRLGVQGSGVAGALIVLMDPGSVGFWGCGFTIRAPIFLWVRRFRNVLWKV